MINRSLISGFICRNSAVFCKLMPIVFLPIALGASLGISARESLVPVIFRFMRVAVSFDGVALSYFLPLLLSLVAVLCNSGTLIATLLTFKCFSFAFYSAALLCSVRMSFMLILLFGASDILHIAWMLLIYTRMIGAGLRKRTCIILALSIAAAALFDFFIASPFLSSVIIQWKG